ncbi:MAG TPA: class I SAM-dependent methyltransferase [Bryobacteraceae bacterium]|nr:class I SAM-dependent methyltransferase [Bryobacteraceae bacterium]
MNRLRSIRRMFYVAAAIFAAFVIIHFPYATDAEPSSAEIAKTIAYYQQAYSAPAATADPNEENYVKTAEQAAIGFHVKEKLQQFVIEHGLTSKKALEVGAGQGYLQDVVDDYTALDISPTAKRFFRKPFVLGSATALPFADSQFDSVWSIWVLEHIPNPEQALREMRRVVKDGGFIYLFPAWTCTSWAADGYEVRPYSDFNPWGKLVKASIPLRSNNYYHAIYTAPIRGMRFATFTLTGSPTRLRYTRLTPNYAKYWVADSDAVSSIDRYEALLWFVSRGDECLNCRAPFGAITERVTDPRLLIRVRKH